MAEIVQGLFGISPEQLNAQREQQLQEQALQYAQLSPLQRAASSMYQGGSRLGGAIAGMMGGEDPAMLRAKQEQQLLQTADTTSLAGLKKLAMDAQAANNPQLASRAFAQYQALQKQQADLATSQAESGLKLAQTGAIPSNIAAEGALTALRKQQTLGLIDEAQFKELSIKSAKAALTAAGVPKDQQASIINNPAALTSYLKQVEDKTEIIEADGQQRLVNKLTGEKIADLGKAPERGTKVNVNVTQKGEEAFVTELGKLDAKKVSDALLARETATSAVNSLNKLATLPSDQLITGQFAGGRVGATNLLATLGLASPSDIDRLATSQQYQKVAGDVILATLGGKLGSGFSNADRDFIASLVPQLETNPEARRKLIVFMQNKNQDIIKESSRLETYARQNKGLSGFEPKIPLSVTPSKANPYAGLSDAELAAKIEAARGRKP